MSKFKPKVGMICFFEGNLVIITQIDTKIKASWFSKKKDKEIEEKKVIDRVYWKIAGSNTGMHSTSIGSASYDWEEYSKEADKILHQAKLVLNDE